MLQILNASWMALWFDHIWYACYVICVQRRALWSEWVDTNSSRLAHEGRKCISQQPPHRFDEEQCVMIYFTVCSRYSTISSIQNTPQTSFSLPARARYWISSVRSKHGLGSAFAHLTNPTLHFTNIPQCTICNRNVHTCAHFWNVHTCAHFCYRMVHCGIYDWCIVGFAQQLEFMGCTHYHVIIDRGITRSHCV